MLCKAARRRHALRCLRQASEQIQLSWLCPTLYIPSSTSVQSRLISHRPSACSPLPKVWPQTSGRRRASTAASPEILQSDGYLRYEPQRDVQTSPEFPFRSALSDMLPHDTDRIILLDDTVAEPTKRLSSNKIKNIEIRGNADEVKATMDACLQVHRFDRAIALLRQLQLILTPSSSLLREAFNDCLQAMIMNMVVNRDKKDVDLINRWVEVDMRKARVEPDARTYALKVKVALATMEGLKRTRTVRRYWELARQGERLNEVASLRYILSEQDLGKLSEIVPQTQIDDELEDYHTSDDLVQIVQQTALAKRPVEEILQTSQKGLGLTSLKRALSLFTGTSHLDSEAGNADQSYAQMRQFQLETDSVDAAVDRWRLEHEKTTKTGLLTNLEGTKLGALLWQWHSILSEKIREELKMVEEAEGKQRRTEPEKLRCEYGPFLRLLKPDHLAALVTICTITLSDRRGAEGPLRLSRMVSAVGRTVEEEVAAERARAARATLLERKVPRKGRRGEGGLQEASEQITSPVQTPSMQSTYNATPRRRNDHHWSEATLARIGAVLCELLFDTAKMVVSKEDSATGERLQLAQPVFARSEIFRAGKRMGIVTVLPELLEKLRKEPSGAMIAKHLPMVCEPEPWTGFRRGGFLGTPTNFVRVKRGGGNQRDYAEAAAERGDLDQIFAGVDVLGKTGWTINRGVFEVMLEAWNSGQGVANLAPLHQAFDMPEKPADSNDRDARIRWFLAMKNIENEKNGLHSIRCFQNLQMEIAKAYLDETFFLPHNIDFRGRAYPMPPYLNQMGADNCRGLLLFANGKELGEVGLRWIKIHLSNVFGYDKVSLSDREKFPMEHLSEISDSVHHPLDGKRWWLQAEQPWQCLAACFELKRALDLPDPTKHVSHLPVHQDGSCNGLQHYAALGGDAAGARQVNLEPGDKPVDVYTGVAELVKAEVQKDAAAGHEIAALLDGRVSRKIVKQTVMTNVYGVTFIGAMRQVRRQINDLMPELFVGQSPVGSKASQYIARKIFKALGALFSGAHDIQYWLGDCASKISTSVSPAQLQKAVDTEARQGTPDHSGSVPATGGGKKMARSDMMSQTASFRSSVIWTSPMRLPVVQPYRVGTGRRIQTNIQKLTLIEPTVADVIDKRKQLQAFPPNFIHSLDATHMLLSALKCDEVGLTFSAVHDSFWTHAADVGTLNRLLRDAFIRMHSEDVIGRLGAEFQTRYRDHLYLASVRPTTPLGKEITAFRAKLHVGKGFVGATGRRQRQYDELLLEARRQSLLKSDDVAKREQGKQIKTACSLFEEMDGEQYLASVNLLRESGLGAIPQHVDPETAERALHSEDTAVAGGQIADADVPDPLVEGGGHSLDDAMNVGEETEAEADILAAKSKAKAKSPSRLIWCWLPLTFKPVPEKGEFDVARLRDSQYFFS